MAGAVAGALPPAVEHVGVDGCPAGWLAAGVDHDGTWRFAVFAQFDDLWTHVDTPERVLVDVPIGLCVNTVRACDEEARDLLGCRWNSVFRTPVQEAVDLKRDEDGDDLRPEASDVNADETGYGLSAQVWNITDKIAELDDFVRGHDIGLDGRVREAHPELAFMAYNGQPVSYSKQSGRGRALRTAILEDEGIDADAVFDRTVDSIVGTDVGRDDVVDAIVLARAAAGELTSVPPDPNGNQPRIYFPDRKPAWDAQSYFSG